MKLARDRSGFYRIKDKGYISSTTVLDRLEKYGLHPWIAAQAAGYVREGILDHLIAGDMTIDQLKEMDLEAFMIQAKREHEAKKREAMALGTSVHAGIEGYYKFGQDKSVLDRCSTIDPRLTAPFLAFLDWEQGFKIAPLNVEMTIWSETHEYAGTLDLHCRLTLPGTDYEQIGVIDHKAATSIYDTNVMQIASYLFALEEMESRLNPMDAPVIDGAGILRLDKETGVPEFRWYDKDDLIMWFECFRSLLEFCKWERAVRDIEIAKRAALKRAAKKAPSFNPVIPKSKVV